MTIFTRKKLVLLIALGIGASIGWKKLGEYADQRHIENVVQQNRYAELAAKQLQAKWQCLPDSETAQEQFMLKLMQRFAPDDYTQLERGKAWVRDYRVKMLTSELTVEERKQAKASTQPYDHVGKMFYTFPWKAADGAGWHSTSQYLAVNDCILNRDTACPSIAALGLRENGLAQMVYQTHGLRWRVTDEQWNELATKEYQKLKNKDAQFAELEGADKRNRALQYEAQQNVAKMSADEVSPSQETQTIQREYLKLLCR